MWTLQQPNFAAQKDKTMVEIEFRFWLGHTKKMTYPHPLSDIGKVVPEFTDDIIPLQYTGKKDKAGNKVYRGDILDFDEKEWGGPNFKSVVEWDEENACWEFGGGTASDVTAWRKVVGNIYEHPELLNK
jgi:hypothetical protein